MIQSASAYGPLELLVIQPTPFCNLDCSYCYLPDRSDKRRMSREMLQRTFDWVFASGLVREPFTLLWHAGEPLVVPIDFYEDAVSMLEAVKPPQLEVHHSFQTNATLIDEAWCAFIQRHGIHMGVSLDGPAFLHDRYRRTRQQKGTLDQVLRGIHLLHDHCIPFHVLSVITAESLNYADELFDFYCEHGITNVGFNVEEIEGPHTNSSMQAVGMQERFREFFARFVDLAYSVDPPLEVREFETSVECILGARFQKNSRTQENKPWAIVNVDCAGNFSTYSPELLGNSGLPYGDFALGNVTTDRLEDVLASPRFRRMEADVQRGVAQCHASCAYFAFCGGGPPANKFFERGTFATTETLSCRLQKQVCIDVTLDQLEHTKAAVTPAATIHQDPE